MRSRKPTAAKRSGATYSNLSSPASARRSVSELAAPSCWAFTSATVSPRPRAASASTWSCISATSGETTTVRSSRSSAGS
jgi:hypothetical protein